MRRMGLAALVILALAGLVMTVSAQEALAIGPTSDTLEAGATVDYALEAGEGDVFVISLTSEDFDTLLQITDEDGSTVASDDDGGFASNSVVFFVVPADATYTVTVSSFDNSAGGAYTISLTSGTSLLEIGTPLTVTIDGFTTTVYQFETEGVVLNIAAKSDNTVDTNLTLVDAQGVRLDSNEDFNGVDPELRQKVLEPGVYFLVLSPYNDTAIGDVTLSLEPTELIVLGVEPTVFVFEENYNGDSATFDVENEKLYRITVSLDSMGDFNAVLTAADDAFFSFGSFSFSHGDGGTFLYRADFTGTILAEISGGFYSGSESNTYSITVEVVEE